jgi:uncharacterized membrane protein
MRAFSRLALAAFFIGAGATHLLMPAPYLAIMPTYVPWPAAMIALSGVAEIVGGLGVCFRATRTAAGWCLVALLVAVFPANIQALSTGIVIEEYSVPHWALWARLPFQLLFIAWVYSACLSALRNRPDVANSRKIPTATVSTHDVITRSGERR